MTLSDITVPEEGLYGFPSLPPPSGSGMEAVPLIQSLLSISRCDADYSADTGAHGPRPRIGGAGHQGEAVRETIVQLQ